MLSGNLHSCGGGILVLVLIATAATSWSTASASSLCPSGVCMTKTCPPPYMPVGEQTSLSPEQETQMHYLKLGMIVFEGYLSVRKLCLVHFDPLMSI